MDLYGRINLTTLAVEEIDLTVTQLADTLGFNTVKETDLTLLGYYPQRNVDSNLDAYQIYGTPTLAFNSLNNTVTVTRVGEDLPLDEAKRLARLNADLQLNSFINSSVAFTFQDQISLTNITINIPLTPNLLLDQIRDQAYSSVGMWVYFVETGDTPPIYGSYVCNTFELVLPDNSNYSMLTLDAVQCMRTIAFFRAQWVFANRTMKDDINAAADLAALRLLSTDLTDYFPTSLPPCS